MMHNKKGIFQFRIKMGTYFIRYYNLANFFELSVSAIFAIPIKKMFRNPDVCFRGRS